MQPALTGIEPGVLPDAIAGAAAATAPLAPVLLPISTTTAAAAALPGVSARASSTLHATAPPDPALAPSGGFTGASQFAMFLLMQSAPVRPLVRVVSTPVVSRTPTLTAVTGGRVRMKEGTVGGGRGFTLHTPFGRVSISHGEYLFGSTHYPMASVPGVLTTGLIALGVLAGIAVLLAAGAVIGRLVGVSGRRGNERRREDLYAAARRRKIPGRSRMSKAELRRALDDR
ncbi:MAG: hypothetical protein QOH15_2428 [Gaiellales bacterium]|nr:hypothetical protein [Gaiellales bacterium]